LLAACLLAAILPVGAVRNRPYLLMAIVVVWLARLVTAWLDHRALSEMALGSWTLIGLLAALAALRFAIGATQVDAEHLYAALSAYLLAGIYLGLSYWVLEQMKPGTFSFAGEFSQASAIYFSDWSVCIRSQETSQVNGHALAVKSPAIFLNGGFSGFG
jgi:hypothetical protein